MFKNGKISSRQIKKLLIFDVISVSIIILPGIAAKGAGRDGLISIILSSALGLLYSFFFLFVSSRLKDEYIDFYLSEAGILSFVLGGLYIVKILFSCWFCLELFVKVINESLLPDTNTKIIFLSLIGVSIYAASKGVEVRARVAEVFFYMVIIPLILLFIFGIKRIELENLFPLLITPTEDILYTSYGILLTYSATEMLLFTCADLTSAEDGRALKKHVAQSVIIVSAINISLFILAIGLLGLPGTASQFKASIIIMQLVKLPGGFVQRQDAIMLSLWMLCLFTVLTAYFYYSVKITCSITKSNKKNFYLILFGLILFLISLLKTPFEKLFFYYGKYMAYIGFPQSIILPLVVIAISKIKKRKGMNS